MEFRTAHLILSGIGISLWAGQFAAHAQTAVTSTVPFVGCKSDGQVGPLDAPAGANLVVKISPETARKFSYYKSAHGLGVLAPNDWQCVGIYGSGGDALFVSPLPFNDRELFSSDWPGVRGPGIVARRRLGHTIGRFDVADIIARIFPANKKFIDGLVESFELRPGSISFGPYRTDTLKYKSATVAEYRTPPHEDGLGTQPLLTLKKNSSPIVGVVMLVGPTPDLLLLGIRLPEQLQPIAPRILQHFEQDVTLHSP